MQFTYEEAESNILNIGVYTLSPARITEFTLKHANVQGNEEESPGWKIHISIDDTDPDNLRRALLLIVPVLIANNIALAKFFKAGWKDNEHGPYDHGRHITLYCELQYLVENYNALKWIELADNISHILREKGIRAGNKSAVCRAFQDNEYASYRHDVYQEHYISCRDVYYENLIKTKYKPTADVIDLFNAEAIEFEPESDDSCCNRCVIL